MAPKTHPAYSQVNYQLLSLGQQRRLLRDRLRQAEAQHFEIVVREELFKAQEDDNKDDALEGVQKEREQAAVSVTILQRKLAEVEGRLGDEAVDAEAASLNGGV